MGREDVVMEDMEVLTDDETDLASGSTPRPHRAGSMSSPPPPPPDFNPPADIPISPVESIASPVVSPASSSASSVFTHASKSSSFTSLGQQMDNSSAHDVSVAAAAAVAAHSLNRPSLRALQRVSNDSMPDSPGSGSGASTLSAASGSEGGEHLAEAREMLLHSGESSRRDSWSTERPIRSSFDSNSSMSTPPTFSRDGTIQEEAREVEAGPSRPRRSSSPVMDAEGNDLPAEHAWDSVWPAPGSSDRHPYASDLNRPHFPTAPVSPYVTPAFSPAIIPTQSIPRRPPSPRMSNSDPSSPVRPTHSASHSHSHSFSQPTSLRSSPRDGRVTSPLLNGSTDDPAFRRRGSVTSSSPLFQHSPPTTNPVSISKHQRSFSASSPSYKDRSYHRDSLNTQQPSSPTSPMSQAKNLVGINEDSSLDRRPGSSDGSRPPSRGSGSSPSLGVSRTRRAGDQPSAKIGRPRGKSLSSLTPVPVDVGFGPSENGRADSPRPGQASPALPPIYGGSLPPISLPPSIATAPVNIGDDGLPQPRPDLAFLSSPLPVNPPLFSPLSRPSAMRRAISDYDTTRTRSVPPLHRSISITAELDKSPKRPINSEEGPSPLSPRLGGDLDLARVKKSPRRSPNSLPTMSTKSPKVPSIVSTDDIPPLESEASANSQPASSIRDVHIDQMGDVNLMDEGDVLPSTDVQMDVTFDDEGLNTLERIFLLSKSEFPFHRAYVARVLGDLLFEVDPCESVEYVLPLLSGFTMDDDESVKEAFASELHRILWYFFSTCKLVIEEEQEEEIAGMEYNPMTETVTVTSLGVDVVPKSTEAVPPSENLRQSSVVSTSSAGSSNAVREHEPEDTPSTSESVAEVGTPASSISDAPSTGATVYSPSTYAAAYADDMDPEKGWVKDIGPLLDRPSLAVSFFTPLLGSLLLSQNPTISESVRTGLVNILVRLKGCQDPQPEVWGPMANAKEVAERRTYLSQSGPHSHDVMTFDKASRDMVETELVSGIIIGMGHLSTDMPEGIFEESIDDAHRALDEYSDYNANTGLGMGYQQEPSHAQMFQEQLIAEATAGRATSMNLIGSLCEYYQPDEVVDRGFVDEVLRSYDGDMSVRAEGAVALSCLAKVAPVEHVYEMIPLFEVFLEDPADHVRQSVCLSLPAFCKRIEDPSYRREFAINAVTSLAAKPDDVRCAILEMLGEVIYVFDVDPLGPPAELLEVFTDDVDPYAGLDGDWDVVAAFNFPGVALTLGSDRWNELQGLYSRLQSRAGDKIMRILAASVHELAKILRPEQVEEDLIPVYERCLTCNDEIRERVYEHVDVIVSRVREEEGWRLFQNLARAWKDGSLGGWRAREQLALHLPSFLETFKDVEKGKEVLEVLRDALLDPFAAVRDGVTKGIPQAYVVLGDDSPVAVKFRDMLLDLGKSPKYRCRLTFVRCLREFIKPPPNQNAFETFFVPSLPSLSEDVVDIRLGLAQAIADLFVIGAYYGKDTGPIPEQIKELAEKLRNDKSRDVVDTLRNVDLKRLHKGKGLPHAISPTSPPDRALRPDDRSAMTQGEVGKTDSAKTRGQTTDRNSKENGETRGDEHTPSNREAKETSPDTKRRQSVEVAKRFDTMNLESFSPSTPTCERQLSLGSSEESTGTINPFAISFSRATPSD